MKKISCKILLFIFIISLFPPIISLSHSGRTDSYGGHYNRSKGTYHYHSGKYAGTGEYTRPIEEGGVPIDEDEQEEYNTVDLDNYKKNQYYTNTSIGNNSSYNKTKELENQIAIKQNTINELIKERDNLKEQIDFLYKIGGITLIAGISYIFYLSRKLDKYED